MVAVVLFTALAQGSAQEVTLPNGEALFEPIPKETRHVFNELSITIPQCMRYFVTVIGTSPKL